MSADTFNQRQVAAQVAGLIDHTSLGDADTEDMILKLVDAAVAQMPHTAAVCVFSKFVPFIRSLQKKDPSTYPRSLRIATVVNFPGGNGRSHEVVAHTLQAVKDGADEIDMVIDYRAMKKDMVKGTAQAEALVRAVRAVCPADSVLLKVIIESGELQTPELIGAACDAALAGGADFLKTSTGKVQVNATLEAAEIMLQKIANYRASALGARCVGFKAAGGVKTLDQSQQYLAVAARHLCGGAEQQHGLSPRLFRFGSSSLLPVLRDRLASYDQARVAVQAAGLIDHTSLGDSDTKEMILKLVDAAVEQAPHTAAVCVYPKFVSYIRSLQNGNPTKYPRTLRIATVVNFPGGDGTKEQTVADTKKAVKDGADEIDMVIDYRALKKDLVKGRAQAEDLVRAVRAACPLNSVQVKVIIESGELQDPELIGAACDAALAGGADFLKTSTGKVKVNATLEAAEIMLRRIAGHRAMYPRARPVGFKAAGGVKTLDQAQDYLALTAEILCGGRGHQQYIDAPVFRFGSSSLLPVLRQRLALRDDDDKVARQAASLIDHTSLGLDDTEAMIHALVDAAVASSPHTAAVCVYPRWVPFIRQLQCQYPDKCPRTLRVATVVNFPGGNLPPDEVVAQAEKTVKEGADEVDMVIDYRALKANLKQGKVQAEALVRLVRAVCPPQTVQLKVIIESGELQTPELIAAASDAALAGGADFVKTSTGKVKVNATLEAAEVMLGRIAAYTAANPGCRRVGFKAAGGVKTLDQARQYLNLTAQILCGGVENRDRVDFGLFRFGSSSLLPALRKYMAAGEHLDAPTEGRGLKRKAETEASY